MFILLPKMNQTGLGLPCFNNALHIPVRPSQIVRPSPISAESLSSINDNLTDYEIASFRI